jgi:hypothetical protein
MHATTGTGLYLPGCRKNPEFRLTRYAEATTPGTKRENTLKTTGKHREKGRKARGPIDHLSIGKGSSRNNNRCLTSFNQ